MTDYVPGYTYQAENLCPDCVLRPEDIGWEWHVEGVLDVIARFMGIDRDDEDSFDSGTFPKRIRREQVQPDEKCAYCGDAL